MDWLDRKAPWLEEMQWEAPSSWDVIPRFYALEGTMGRIHSVRWAHSQIIILLCYTYIIICIYIWICIYIIINNYIHIYRHYTYTHMLHDFYPCVKQLEYWWFSTPFICAGKWATAAVLLQARTHARSEAAVRLAAKGTRRPVGPWDRSTARRSSGLGVHGIDVLFPLVGWWK